MLDTLSTYFESKGINVLQNVESRLEVEFPLGDGRTRILDFLNLGEFIGRPVLRVAASFEWQIDPETIRGIASNLLFRNARSQKVGHFAICSDSESGPFMLFLQHEFMSEQIDANEIVAVAVAIATSADAFERELHELASAGQ